MDPSTRKKLIDQYNDGYRVVSEALAGATDEELDAHPAPGKWSAREIVHHLADSEMTSAIRLRLLLAVDNPKIEGLRPGGVRAAAVLRSADRSLDRGVQVGAADDRRDSGPDDRRGVVPPGDAQRAPRLVHGRAMAGNLRRARARSRDADPGGARGGAKADIDPRSRSQSPRGHIVALSVDDSVQQEPLAHGVEPAHRFLPASRDLAGRRPALDFFPHL